MEEQGMIFLEKKYLEINLLVLIKIEKFSKKPLR
jgi:hypothetical protein